MHFVQLNVKEVHAERCIFRPFRNSQICCTVSALKRAPQSGFKADLSLRECACQTIVKLSEAPPAALCSPLRTYANARRGAEHPQGDPCTQFSIDTLSRDVTRVLAAWPSEIGCQGAKLRHSSFSREGIHTRVETKRK